MNETHESTNYQEEHFDRIQSEYHDEYDDKYSLFYKRELIFKKISSSLDHLDKSNLQLLEVACGSGVNVEQLKIMSAKNLQTVGVDISGEAVRQFKRRHGDQSALQVDFTLKQPPLPTGPFDVVLIMGGIHHMVRDLDTVFQNIYDNLIVGGLVIFVEPNRRFLNSIRQQWYRRSRYFDSDTEEAIDHDEIAFVFRDLFSTKEVSYFGGPGFFVILQSLILRTPKFIKATTYRPLTAIDKTIGRVLPSRLLPAFVAIWHKR